VFGVLFVLVTLVPVVHTSPPDAMWIAGIYDAGDFDEVVWMLIGTDSVAPPVQIAARPPLLLRGVLTRPGVSPVV